MTRRVMMVGLTVLVLLWLGAGAYVTLTQPPTETLMGLGCVLFVAHVVFVGALVWSATK